MKSNKTGFLIVAALMILAASLISVLSVRNAKDRGGVYFSMGGTAKLRNTIELSLSDVDNLEVIYTSKNLDIYPTEGNSIIIKEYLISDRPEAVAVCETVTDEATGSRTVTVTGGKEIIVNIFGFFAGRERIEVYIPADGLHELKLQTGSGNINAESDFALNIEKLSVQAGSGNIKWHDTKAAEMTVQAGSGNIRMERISGDITAQTGSGNIRIDGFSGQGSVKAGSGNVNVEFLEAAGDMHLKTGSGNLHLELSKELSFQFEVQTGSGNIHTFFDDQLSYNKKGNHAEGTIGDSPSCVISAEANSGNVTITAG
ncbi:MAG: DUF4097 domain-containing protein [Lachnospiraceae bacterium]|nr:DUF4097 domain-containing protein [Lachnospiraceae bacterium]